MKYISAKSLSGALGELESGGSYIIAGGTDILRLKSSGIKIDTIVDIANITIAYALKIAGCAIIIWLAIQGAIISAGIEENLDLIRPSSSLQRASPYWRHHWRPI